MALARVWPDNWTGHALQRILTTYRWIANCGKAKTVQVHVLIDFINHVLALNATNGRLLKPPLTYLKIEEAMSNRIWSINREACQTGRDPYSSTPDGTSIPKYDGYHDDSNTFAQPGAGSGQSGSKKGKEPAPRRRAHRKASPSSAGDSTLQQAATSQPDNAGTSTPAAGASTPTATATRRTTTQTTTPEHFINHVIEWSQ